MAVSSLDERQLVESHRSGDADAFVQIVDNYYPELLSHAVRRLREPKSAEDAVQEALLRAYRALPRFNGEYRLGAWLHRILENVCADEGNRRRRENELFDRVSALPILADPEPHDAATANMPDPGFVRALASLSPTYREALLLRYVDGLPYREVASVTGVTEENARARVHRARNVLRKLLGGAAGALGWFVAGVRRSERAVAHPIEQAATRLPMGAAQLMTAGTAVPGKAMVASRVASLVAAVTLPVAGIGIGSTIDWIRSAKSQVPGAASAAAEASAGERAATSLAAEAAKATDPLIVLHNTARTAAAAPVKGGPTTTARVDGDTARWGWFQNQPDNSNTGPGENDPRDAQMWSLDGGVAPVKASGTATQLRGEAVLRAPDSLLHGALEATIDLPDDRRADEPVRILVSYVEDGGRSQPVQLTASGTLIRQGTDAGKARYGVEGRYTVAGREVGLARTGRFRATVLVGGTDPSAVELRIHPEG